MKDKLLLIIFIFSFVGFKIQAVAVQSTKTVSVELELEEIPNVATYEIEVKKISKKNEKVHSYSQETANFKIKIPVGNYLVRTRIKTKQDQLGPWSEWSELLARPEEVELFEMPSYNVAVSKKRQNSDVEIKWDKANGADKYVVWVEDLRTNKVVKKTSLANEFSLSLNVGEYKVGVQSVSKDGIKSEVKYYENTFYVAHAQLPAIKLQRLDRDTFKWKKEKDSDVKIEIYRKPFFGDKFVRIDTIKESGVDWRLPKSLEPGEYRLEFQYISEAFVNGPVETVSLIKKPTENDFKNQINK